MSMFMMGLHVAWGQGGAAANMWSTCGTDGTQKDWCLLLLLTTGPTTPALHGAPADGGGGTSGRSSSDELDPVSLSSEPAGSMRVGTQALWVPGLPRPQHASMATQVAALIQLAGCRCPLVALPADRCTAGGGTGQGALLPTHPGRLAAVAGSLPSLFTRATLAGCSSYSLPGCPLSSSTVRCVLPAGGRQRCPGLSGLWGACGSRDCGGTRQASHAPACPGASRHAWIPAACQPPPTTCRVGLGGLLAWHPCRRGRCWCRGCAVIERA